MINRKTHQQTTAQRQRAQRGGWAIDSAREERRQPIGEIRRIAATNELRRMAGHALVVERAETLDVRVPFLSVDAVRELLEYEAPPTLEVTVSSMSLWEHIQILFGWLSGVHWYYDLES